MRPSQGIEAQTVSHTGRDFAGRAGFAGCARMDTVGRGPPDPTVWRPGAPGLPQHGDKDRITHLVHGRFRERPGSGQPTSFPNARRFDVEIVSKKILAKV